jgi:WD40 repeat protein
MENNKKYRYPGTNYFKSTDEDIFCGRKEDSQKLYAQIILSSTVVLHSASGIGKSSLIRAGVTPLLKKNNSNILPITIRFGKVAPDNEFLINDTITQIKDQCPPFDYNLPYLIPKENDLWYLAKALENKGFTLLLLFDQFEELQAFSYKQINYFKEKLSELFNSDLPVRIDDEIEKNTNELLSLKESSPLNREDYNSKIKFLEKPLQTKAVFIIRDDKLGLISLLSDLFPNILKNDFHLLPLDVKNARFAIEEPARLKEDKYLSTVFEIKDEVSDHIIKTLKDPNTGLIDPIQIQIICSKIERTKLKSIKEISLSDMPPIKNIITAFYNESWAQAISLTKFSEIDFEENKLRILQQLIVNEKRNLVNKQVLLKLIPEKNEDVLKELTDTGLLVEVRQVEDIFYQLCHDRLIAPASDDLKRLKLITETRQERKTSALKEKENRQKLRLFSAIAMILTGLLVTTIIMALLWKRAQYDIKEKQVLAIAKTIRKSNPTLSYVILKHWINEDRKPSKEFTRYLNEFDSSKFSYLLSTIPYKSFSFPKSTLLNESEIIAIEAKKEGANISEVKVQTSQLTSKWNINEGILLSQEASDENEVIIKRFKLRDSVFYAKINKDTLNILNEYSGSRYIFPFNRYSYTWNILLLLSNNGKYLLVNDTLYNFKNREVIAIIPDRLFLKPLENDLVSFFDKDVYLGSVITGCFFNDNTRLAIAFQGGYLAIFKVDENSNDNKLKISAIFRVDNESYSVISSLATAKEDKYLITGSNLINVWVVDSIIKIAPLDSLESNYRKRYYLNRNYLEPYHTLTGHDGRITCLSVSESGDYILSGSEDNSAILWNLETGKRVTVLKASPSKINSVGFLNNEDQMYTASDDGIIYIWRRQKASIAFTEKYLANITPLDFYTFGNDMMNAGEVYDTSNLKNLSAGLLHYMINMPSRNQYSEDINYLRCLQKSFAEIEHLYNSLTKNVNYKDSLSLPVKSLIISYYLELKYFISPILLLKAEDKKVEDEKVQEAEYCNEIIMSYFHYFDTSELNNNEIKSGILLKTRELLEIIEANENLKVSQQKKDEFLNTINRVLIQCGQTDSFKWLVIGLWNNLISYYAKIKDYKNAFKQLKIAVDKYGDDSQLWYRLSYYALFVNEYQVAMNAALKTLELDHSKDGVKTNLALAYLLNNEWEKAKQIYLDYKDKYFNDYLKISNDIFLEDIDALQSAGITHPDFKKVRILLNE